MKRSALPVRSTPMRRFTRLRPVSLRRAAENRERHRVLARLGEERGPLCQRGCGRPWMDGHELLSRARGGSITDGDNIALLCRTCHDWVTTHPAEAAAEGWARSRWGK